MKLFAALLPLLLTQIALAADQQSTRPNVVMIIVDDLNDWVGCLDAHPQTITPHIDRLAASGAMFSNAHCQAPICGPSRASFLSGIYPRTSGVYLQPRGNSLQEDERYFRGHLLPEYFRKHGYRTFGVGKITHGYDANLAFEEYGGKFDGYGPKPSGGRRFNYHLPDVPWTGTQTDWGKFPDSDDQMPDYKSARWAVDVLNRTHEQPFFLTVGFIRPHVPFYVPAPWFEPFPVNQVQLPLFRIDDLADVPLIGRRIHELPKYPNLAWLRQNRERQFRKCVQAYLACVHFVDAQIGKVIRALQDSNYADKTVVVLLADHGYHLGEKDRVSKHSLWEESTRVPLIVVPAGNLSSPSNGPVRCSKPVGLIDLYPTLLDLCNLPAKESNQGRSLAPLLHDPDADWRFAISTTYPRVNMALRSQRYRYIRYQDGSEELYDHLVDPHEWTNLAGEAGVAAIQQRFQAALPRNYAPYHASTQSRAINAWFQKHLESYQIR